MLMESDNILIAKSLFTDVLEDFYGSVTAQLFFPDKSAEEIKVMVGMKKRK